MFYYTFVTTDTYKRFNSAESAHFTLSNDSLLNDLDFSLNGTDLIGTLLPEETVDFRDSNIEALHVKSRLAGASCITRLWFYGKQSLLYPQDELDKVNRQVPVHKTFEKIIIND